MVFVQHAVCPRFAEPAQAETAQALHAGLLLPVLFFTAISAPWFADLVIDALGTA
jgi:hypothetical protein